LFRAILKTAISSLGLLFFISFFLFLLIYFLPGNVTDAMFLRSEAVSVVVDVKEFDAMRVFLASPEQI